jgi:hypothetical protein
MSEHATCPECGADVKGTAETVLGTAIATFHRDANGKVTYDHVGETEICWDSQETETEDGEPVCECEEGCRFKLSEIVWEEDDEEDDNA